jgi:hypothetical protein
MLASATRRTCALGSTGCAPMRPRAPYPSEELRGATITLKNFGMIGGRYANLVVVPPQVAIIGAGRGAQGVLAHRGAPAVRRALPLSLTFDPPGGDRRRSGPLPGGSESRSRTEGVGWY